MDSISFDCDHYFPEDAFVIDDLGEICEDIVKIASASPYIFDDDLRHDSPPGSFYTQRCFEKEMPSLFSEMEYLTEVSPETEMVVTSIKPTVVVNPSEFSWKRKEKEPREDVIEAFIVKQPVIEPVPALVETEPVVVTECPAVIATTDYRRILQNYIQKGKRKLEASSYSKMKATVVGEKLGTKSTSLIETVTFTSFMQQQQHQQQYQPHAAITALNPLAVAESSTEFSSLPIGTMLSHHHTSCLPYRNAASVAIPVPRSGISTKPIRTYRCQDCGSSFPSNDLLRRHTCIIAEQYQCHLCLREFKKRKTLDQHMKSHDKVFSTDEDLRK